MSINFKKYRLTNHRSVKPFWSTPSDILLVYNTLDAFQKKLISMQYRLRFPLRKNCIDLAQVPIWKFDGYEIKRVRKVRKIGRFKSVTKYNYITNNKMDEWYNRGIYQIPKLKCIKTMHDLKDPSGIHPIGISAFSKLIVEHCIGTYYQNSINYFKYTDNCKIQLSFIDEMNLDEDGNPISMTDISANIFLKHLFDHYVLASKKRQQLKELNRLAINSIYGVLGKNLMSLAFNGGFRTDYMNQMMDVCFGHYDFVIDTESFTYSWSREISTDYLWTLESELTEEIKNCAEAWKNDSNGKEMSLNGATIKITFVAKKL